MIEISFSEFDFETVNRVHFSFLPGRGLLVYEWAFPNGTVNNEIIRFAKIPEILEGAIFEYMKDVACGH